MFQDLKVVYVNSNYDLLTLALAYLWADDKLNIFIFVQSANYAP